MENETAFVRDFLIFVERQHPWARSAFSHPSFTSYFVSQVTLPLSKSEQDAMTAAILALHRVRNLPGYQSAVLGRSSLPTPPFESGFMGFDFYLTAQGPRLIEINTNAAAQLVMAFLNDFHGAAPGLAQTESLILDMLLAQFKAVGRFETPAFSVILDQGVNEQKTYFDMALHAAMMQRWGWDVRVADVAELVWDTGRQRLVDSVTGRDIDYVYNRYCDFDLTQPESAALRQAWEAQATVISPHPIDYALMAQKSQLKQLSNPEFLQGVGVSEADISAIHQVLPPVKLTSDFSPDALWAERRQLFFKPQASFGSRGCYRGDGITKKAFDHVLTHNYVVQPLFVSKTITHAQLPSPMKFDIRAYSYAGTVQGWAARLFSGQVTNFRTLGGGFATVVVD